MRDSAMETSFPGPHFTSCTGEEPKNKVNAKQIQID